MEDINLHFTNDFPAVESAHNLLSAILDNTIFHGNPEHRPAQGHLAPGCWT